jgi:hypothetical protein
VREGSGGGACCGSLPPLGSTRRPYPHPALCATFFVGRRATSAELGRHRNTCGHPGPQLGRIQPPLLARAVEENFSYRSRPTEFSTTSSRVITGSRSSRTCSKNAPPPPRPAPVRTTCWSDCSRDAPGSTLVGATSVAMLLAQRLLERLQSRCSWLNACWSDFSRDAPGSTLVGATSVAMLLVQRLLERLQSRCSWFNACWSDFSRDAPGSTCRG